MKKIMLIALMIGIVMLVSSCSTISVNQGSEAIAKAHIKVFGATTSIDVKDFVITTNGVAKIIGTDGKIYRTHMANVVIVEENSNDR